MHHRLPHASQFNDTWSGRQECSRAVRFAAAMGWSGASKLSKSWKRLIPPLDLGLYRRHLGEYGFRSEASESAIGTNSDDDTLVLSYLNLRRTVGVLGVLLPVILVVGDLVLGSSTGLEDSISDYYGTIMRGVLVGVLFAIGVFMFSYIGYQPIDKKRFEPSDNMAGDLACVAALGVALFPTTSSNSAVRTIHFLSAAALFLVLSYFSLRLFTKTEPGGRPTPEKKARNRIYVTCGVIMLACIASIAVYNWFLQDTSLAATNPVFWLETFALWAFGVSWFIKGETLFKDTQSPLPTQ